MPLLSAFTPFGQLEFSSEPSEAEKIYLSLLANYRDPASGQTTLDVALGTYKEAQLYGWAMAMGDARVMLRAAGNELRPETSFAQLEAQEAKYRMTPGPNDSVATRRAALAAKEKAARGPRYEAVWDGLSAILGANLLAYRPIKTSEAFAFPSSPSTIGIFRRSDAVAKSIRILDAIARPGDADEICDQYVFANQSTQYNIGVTGGRIGQTFTGDGGNVSRAVFYLRRNGTVSSASAVAQIYEISGTYGTDAVPTGAPLATSTSTSLSTLDPSTFAAFTFSFTGANQILLEDGKRYAVVLVVTASFGTEASVRVAQDNTTPTHAGNAVVLSHPTDITSAWVADSSTDFVFYVYTFLRMEVAYENWNKRLTDVLIVKGDVLLLDPGNWGVAEKVTVTDASGTGTARKFKARFLKPHSANIYATNGPMPLWTNTKRHVFIVVKAAASVDPTTRARVDELLRRIMRGPTTWAIVQPTSPGAATIGPFKVGSSSGSPLGAVPVGTITV